ADEDEVDARGVGEPAARRVVGRDHHDLVAAPLHLGQLGERQLAGRPGGVARGLRVVAHESSPSRRTLSIKRVEPTRTAAARTLASPRSSTSTYSGSRPFSEPHAAATGSGLPTAAPSARGSASARSRSSVERRTLRDETASPSASRTVGTTRTSTGTFRSRTRRRITATCCASFWPKYARSGRTMLNSLRQTVATPRKWPGRALPSRLADRFLTSTHVSKPYGY